MAQHTLHGMTRKPLIQKAPASSGMENAVSFEDFIMGGYLDDKAEKFLFGGKAKRREKREKRAAKRLEKRLKRLNKREQRKLEKKPHKADKIRARFDKKEQRAIALENERAKHGRFGASLRGMGDTVLSTFGAGNVIQNSMHDTQTPEFMKKVQGALGNVLMSVIPGGQAVGAAARLGNSMIGQQQFDMNPAIAGIIGNQGNQLPQGPVVPQQMMAQAQHAGAPDSPQGGMTAFGMPIPGMGGGYNGMFANAGTNSFNPASLFGGVTPQTIMAMGQGFNINPQIQQPQPIFLNPQGGYGPAPQGGGGGNRFSFNDAMNLVNTGLDIYNTFSNNSGGGGFGDFLGGLFGGSGKKGGYAYQGGGEVSMVPMQGKELRQWLKYKKKEKGEGPTNKRRRTRKEFKELKKHYKGAAKDYKKGVKKYQAGGFVQDSNQLVDIQAEKGELIYHPTGYLTDVHAKKKHSQLRGANKEKITDHPLDGSFIFSDYLKINKSDAQDIVVGVRRHRYEEGKKGKEPEIFTVGDLYKGNKKKMTPADMARSVKRVWKVTNDTKDVFNVIGDKMNMENRKPYLEAIMALSEVEREKDDMMETAKEARDLIFAKKGGRMRSRRVMRGDGYYRPVPKLQDGGGAMFNPNYDDILPIPNTRPPVYIPPIGPANGLPGTSGLPPSISSTDPNVGTGQFNPQVIIDAASASGLFPSNPYGPPPGQGGQGGQQNPNLLGYQTTIQDFGSPFLRGAGAGLMTTGAAINFGSNLAGAIGSYNLNNAFRQENQQFYDQQRNFANRGRDIASAGNLFDVGMNFLQQGPEDLPINQANRLRAFNPQQGVNFARQAAQSSLGDINSMFANAARFGGANSLRGLAIGDAISANNQSIAGAQQNALQQQFGIDNQLDSIDFQNANILANNRQRRTDFGNSLIQGARPGFQGFFGNESSRQMDMAGLARGEREADIAFRQNMLFQPIQFASTAGQTLFDSGATAYGFGTNWMPVQNPIYG